MGSVDLMVRVLGPVQLVTSTGEVIDLPSASQRRLLAALALHAPRPVRTEWLCNVLDVTPGALRTSVARLRKALGEGVVHTSAVGYRLAAPVDANVACEELELGSRARTRLHAQAFDAVRSSSSSPPTERLARHAEQAGLLAEAQYWATEAGDRALANLAHVEAVEWFERALGHATALARPDEERADLLVRIGESAYRAGHPAALDFLYDGAVLAERCGADAILRRAALATDPGSIQYGAFAPKQLAISEAALARIADADHDTRVRITARFAQSLAHTDRTAARRAAAFEALAMAQASEDRTLIARIAPDLMYAFSGPGLGAVRAELAEAAIAVVETAGDPHLAFVVYHAAHTAAVCAGDAERAQICLDGMRAMSRDVQEPRMRWTTGVVDAFDATMRARFDEAEQLIGATYQLGTQIADALRHPVVRGSGVRGRHLRRSPRGDAPDSATPDGHPGIAGGGIPYRPCHRLRRARPPRGPARVAPRGHAPRDRSHLGRHPAVHHPARVLDPGDRDSGCRGCCVGVSRGSADGG